MRSATRKQDHWYHPELDALRFSAFLLVFLFHASGSFRGIGRGPLHGFVPGAFGVDLFFTLSAYLITEILLREWRAKGSIDIGAFYVRRILRIWPLYFCFLLFTWIVVPHLLTFERFPLRAKVAYLVFVANWQWLLKTPVRSVAAILWSVRRSRKSASSMDAPTIQSVPLPSGNNPLLTLVQTAVA